MRLLRGIGTGLLAGGIALAVHAQNGQNGQSQNANTAPTTNNNVPINPPTVPPSDASVAGYTGRETSGYGGYGTGQSGNPGGLYGSGQNGTPGMGRGNNPLGEDTPQNQQQMEQQQARARNAERQKQLVEDTQKLVALANELQDEVNKSNKDMLSLDVVRKADEIDKLARNVRDRMKNAN